MNKNLKEITESAEKELKWGGYIGTNTRCFVCGRTEDEINQIVRDNFKLRGGVGDSHLSQDEIDNIEVMVYDPLCDMALPLEVSKIGMVYFRISLCQVCEQLFIYLAHSKIGQWASILSRDISSRSSPSFSVSAWSKLRLKCFCMALVCKFPPMEISFVNIE